MRYEREFQQDQMRTIKYHIKVKATPPGERLTFTFNNDRPRAKKYPREFSLTGKMLFIRLLLQHLLCR